MSGKNRGKWTVSLLFLFKWEASAKLLFVIPAFLDDA